MQVQGQIYHRLGSLLPYNDGEYQFLQLYFVGNANHQADFRCTISSHARRQIIGELQEMLLNGSELIKLFQTALQQMPSDDYCVKIRADKTPVGEHPGRFNAPTMEEFNSRDIILRSRSDGKPQRVCETHRCYDALQYPLLFPKGEDGYHLQLKMINPITGDFLLIHFISK